MLPNVEKLYQKYQKLFKYYHDLIRQAIKYNEMGELEKNVFKQVEMILKV